MDYKDHQSQWKNIAFWFKAKSDLINILLSKACLKGKKMKILDLGAGTGEDLDILNKYGRVYVIDINRRALNLIPKQSCFERALANAGSLPYKNDFFDIVVSFDVLEHIANDAAAVSEVYRVLKKHGILIFSVPAFQFLFGGHDIALEHKRRYSKKMLRVLLSKFIDLELNYWNFTLFFPLALSKIYKPHSNEADINISKLAGSILYRLLRIENKLIEYGANIPLGVTIIGSCKK